MAYGIKYRFRTWSVHGVLYTVNLLKNGWSGSVTERPLGGSPVIRMQENGQFRATSCNLKLECQTDGEFAELYTSDPNEFQVQVFRGGDLSGGGELVWTGFVATEIYAEPDIAPPYDVDITATDGLGILKEYDFPARGVQKFREQLAYLLAQTGQELLIRCATTLSPLSMTVANLFDATSIDMDYMAGETCYDVLDEILRTFRMVITQYRGAWYIIREGDVQNQLTNSGGLIVTAVPSRQGSSSSSASTTINNVQKTIGQMGVADVWPVGFMTRRVVPAKKSVSVEAPWHPNDLMKNPDMTADSEWTKVGVTWNAGGYYYFPRGNAYILYQSVSAAGVVGSRFSVTLKASRAPEEDTDHVVYIRFTFQPTGSSTTWWYDTEEKKWTTTQPQHAQQFELGTANTNPSMADTFTVDIPSVPLATDTSGVFELSVYGRSANLFHAGVTRIMNKGYRDTLVIDNGARGKDDNYVISGGRVTEEDVPDSTQFLGVFAVLSSPGTPIYKWSDNRFSGKDLMSITAMDYARAVAVPRIELTGTFDLPSGLSFFPLVLSLRGTNHMLATYDWNLKEEEINFKALSVPTATLEVDTETITSLGD